MTNSAPAKKTPAKKSKKINFTAESTPGATVEQFATPAAPSAGLSKKEFRSVRCVLKLVTLDKVRRLSAKERDAIAEPSEKAVQEFVASAREIGLDLAHGSWEKKARALKAGDLRLALSRKAAKTTAVRKFSVSSDSAASPGAEVVP